MTAWDMWFDEMEREGLASGAPGVAPTREVAPYVGVPSNARTTANVGKWIAVQQRANGATSGPRSSSGSKEGSGQP
jgi:hypothetical protein